jgi:hypothetical protein
MMVHISIVDIFLYIWFLPDDGLGRAEALGGLLSAIQLSTPSHYF